MIHENYWSSFQNGQTIGTRGSEGGNILRDEEHRDGARITLEQGGFAPFAITCGIYGLMFHTAFAAEEQEAQETFAAMKEWLAEILRLIPDEDDPELEAKKDKVYATLENFVSQF